MKLNKTIQFKLMNETDKSEFYEALTIVSKDIIENIDPLYYHDYHFDEYIKEEIFKHFEQNVLYDEIEILYDSLIDLVFIENNLTKRSYLKSDERFDISRDNEVQIQYLKNIPQPAQKTPEWYVFRKKHFTGSNIWKLFSTESAKRQLIYEKLAPSSQKTNHNSLSEGPLNWGHKYEPLSIMFYEHFNDVSVEEFGCVPHKSIPFLAASPDGIVTSKKYNGRMVEIKNVVSREITGIPKMEYYIQMQLQMEVCDLYECDFIETKFLEYENEKEFYQDKENVKKGMIMVFVKNNESFVYEYCPLFHTRESQINEFIEMTYKRYNIDDPQIEVNHIHWFRNVYWKLDLYSCVYVPRNKLWFKRSYPVMEETWSLIEKEQKEENSYLKYKGKTNTKNANTPKPNPNIVIL